MGEKGSIKNLYKSWCLFLEEKKKQKRNKEKKKKLTKIKTFFVTLFTFILSPFFFGIKNNKKDLKKSKKQIDLLILEIEKEKNPEILIALKQELKNEKTKLKKNSIQKNERKIKKQIDIIEKAEQQINLKIKELDKPLSKPENLSEELEDYWISNAQIIKSNLKKQPKAISNNVENQKEKISIPNLKDPEILEFLNYMKLEINTIEYKLKSDLNVFQFKYLKSRIIELSYKRENFKDNFDFSKIADLYQSKDKYHLFKSNEILEKLYQKCNDKIKDLDNQKKQKQENVELKEKKQQLQTINFDEISKVNIFLEKEIKKQQLQVSKLKLTIFKTDTKLRKPTLLTNIKQMVKNSTNLCLGLVPISIFKNKLLGGLFSAFMLNNSIRSIRNLINDEQIEYAKLLSNINNQKDCIFHTRLVYEDAITQIEFLKYDLLAKFSFTDLKDIFNKFYEIEEEIKIKNKMLSDLELELEQTYTQFKKKTKKHAA